MTNTAEMVEKPVNEIVLYSEFQKQLAELKEKNKVVFEYNTPKGEKEARSHIQSIRNVKGNLERARVDAKADILVRQRLVDSQAKAIREELDGLILVHKKPLDEIEEKEAARVEAIKHRIEWLSRHKHLDPNASAEALVEVLAETESFAIDDTLQEFKAAAAIAKDAALAEVKQLLQARQQYEAEQAELARLREEANARAQKDREEQIAREAADKARKDAEAKAEQERQAEIRAQQERDRAQQEEARRQELALANAQREKAEAEARAAKAEKDAKEKAERELALQQKQEREAAEKREADKKHQAAINNAAVDALVKAGLSKDAAVLAITTIAQRKVPNVTIVY